MIILIVNIGILNVKCQTNVTPHAGALPLLIRFWFKFCHSSSWVRGFAVSFSFWTLDPEPVLASQFLSLYPFPSVSSSLFALSLFVFLVSCFSEYLHFYLCVFVYFSVCLSVLQSVFLSLALCQCFCLTSLALPWLFPLFYFWLSFLFSVCLLVTFSLTLSLSIFPSLLCCVLNLFVFLRLCFCLWCSSVSLFLFLSLNLVLLYLSHLVFLPHPSLTISSHNQISLPGTSSFQP